MWQVTSLVEKQGTAKFCGFSTDEQNLLVATQDGRFFQISFHEQGEITGCDLLTASRLNEEN